MTSKEFIEHNSFLFAVDEKARALSLYYNFGGSDFLIKTFSLADYIYPQCTPKKIIGEIKKKIKTAELAGDITNYSDDLYKIIAEIQEAQSEA